MKRTLFLLLSMTALFVGCVPCARCHAQTLDPTKKIGEHDDNYNIGKSVDNLPLPTGDQKIWLTLIVADDYENSPRDLQVNRWFYNHPRLIKIREAVHFNCYRVSNPLYAAEKKAGGMGYAYGTVTPALGATRAAKYPGETDLQPILRIREGASMPKDPDELADMIYDSLAVAFQAPKVAGQSDSTPLVQVEDCPDGNCKPFQPKVNPGPAIQPDEIVPPKQHDWMLYAALIAGAGAIVCFFIAGIVVIILVATRKQKPAASGPSGLL